MDPISQAHANLLSAGQGVTDRMTPYQVPSGIGLAGDIGAPATMPGAREMLVPEIHKVFRMAHAKLAAGDKQGYHSDIQQMTMNLHQHFGMDSAAIAQLYGQVTGMDTSSFASGHDSMAGGQQDPQSQTMQHNAAQPPGSPMQHMPNLQAAMGQMGGGANGMGAAVAGGNVPHRIPNFLRPQGLQDPTIPGLGEMVGNAAMGLSNMLPQPPDVTNIPYDAKGIPDVVPNWLRPQGLRSY